MTASAVSGTGGLRPIDALIVTLRERAHRDLARDPAAHAAKVQLIIDRTAGVGAVVDRNGAGDVVAGGEGERRARAHAFESSSDLVATLG